MSENAQRRATVRWMSGGTCTFNWRSTHKDVPSIPSYMYNVVCTYDGRLRRDEHFAQESNAAMTLRARGMCCNFPRNLNDKCRQFFLPFYIFYFYYIRFAFCLCRRRVASCRLLYYASCKQNQLYRLLIYLLINLFTKNFSLTQTNDCAGKLFKVACSLV